MSVYDRVWDAAFYDKGGMVYNIKNKYYDAAGDGINDDSAVIQAAINDAAAVGGVVFSPPGDYLIGTRLTLPGDTALQGVGRESKIIGNNLTTALLSSPNVAARYYGWRIRDLAFDNKDKANAGGIGLDVTNVSLGHFANIYFTNVEKAIHVKDEAFYNDFYSPRMSDVVTGIHLVDGAASGANENSFYSPWINTATTGVIVDGSTNNAFYKPAIEASTTGFSLAPTAATQFTKIDQPRLEGLTTGIINGATAQATLVLGGLVSSVTTRYTNAAAATEFAWLANDVAAWLRPRLSRLLMCDDADSIKAQIYADATRLFLRNSADSGDLNLWCGDIVSSGRVQGATLAVGTPAAATTPGSVTNKFPVYNAAGALVGYVPVYDAIS